MTLGDLADLLEEVGQATYDLRIAEFKYRSVDNTSNLAELTSAQERLRELRDRSI